MEDLELESRISVICVFLFLYLHLTPLCLDFFHHRGQGDVLPVPGLPLVGTLRLQVFKAASASYSKTLSTVWSNLSTTPQNPWPERWALNLGQKRLMWLCELWQRHYQVGTCLDGAKRVDRPIYVLYIATFWKKKKKIGNIIIIRHALQALPYS